MGPPRKIVCDSMQRVGSCRGRFASRVSDRREWRRVFIPGSGTPARPTRDRDPGELIKPNKNLVVAQDQLPQRIHTNGGAFGRALTA